MDKKLRWSETYSWCWLWSEEVTREDSTKAKWKTREGKGRERRDWELGYSRIEERIHHHHHYFFLKMVSGFEKTIKTILICKDVKSQLFFFEGDRLVGFEFQKTDTNWHSPTYQPQPMVVRSVGSVFGVPLKTCNYRLGLKSFDWKV